MRFFIQGWPYKQISSKLRVVIEKILIINTAAKKIATYNLTFFIMTPQYNFSFIGGDHPRFETRSQKNEKTFITARPLMGLCNVDYYS